MMIGKVKVKYYMGIICLMVVYGAFGLTDDEVKLLVAARVGDMHRVRALVGYVNVDVQDELDPEDSSEDDFRGRTAIGMAHQGQIKKWTPLIYASYGGHVPIVRNLLENGASKLVRDSKGKTALDYAQKRHDADLIKLLTKF